MLRSNCRDISGHCRRRPTRKKGVGKESSNFRKIVLEESPSGELLGAEANAVRLSFDHWAGKSD